MPINDKIKKLIGGLFGIGSPDEMPRPRVGSTVEASPLPVDGDTPITAQRPRIVPGKPIGQDVGIQTIGGTEQVPAIDLSRTGGLDNSTAVPLGGRTIAPPTENIAQGTVMNDPGPMRVEPTPGTSELGTTMAQKPQSFMSMGDGSMPGSRQYMFALGRSEQPETAPVAEGETSTPTTPTTAAKPKTYTQSEIERRLGKELYKGGKDEDKDHNWWDAVKSAALGFRKGGIMGAIYGGVEGAFDPNADERMGNEYALGQLNRNRQMELSYENQELARKQAEQEGRKREADIAMNEFKAIQEKFKAIQSQNPVLWEAIEKKGYIDEADQKLLAEKGYGTVPLGDWRRFDRAFDAQGNEVATPQTGAPNYRSTGLVRPDEGVTTYRGIPVKPAVAVTAVSQDTRFDAGQEQNAAERNAKAIQDAAETNARNMLAYNKSLIDQIQSVADGTKKTADNISRMNEGLAKAQEMYNNGDYEGAERAAQGIIAEAQANSTFAAQIARMQQMGIAPPQTVKPQLVTPSLVTKPSRAALIEAMRKEGIKPNSPDWKKAMEAAGYR